MNVFELFASISLDTTSFEQNADKSKNKFEEIGESAEDAAKSTDIASGGIDGLIDKMQGAIIKGELMAKAIGGIFEVVKNLATWVFTLDNATEEYRVAQGKLNTAFKTAGYSAANARDVYRDFYKILGDTDTATEASQLLAKLAENQQEMQKDKMNF